MPPPLPLHVPCRTGAELPELQVIFQEKQEINFFKNVNSFHLKMLVTKTSENIILEKEEAVLSPRAAGASSALLHCSQEGLTPGLRDSEDLGEQGWGPWD